MERCREKTELEKKYSFFWINLDSHFYLLKFIKPKLSIKNIHLNNFLIHLQHVVPIVLFISNSKMW